MIDKMDIDVCLFCSLFDFLFFGGIKHHFPLTPHLTHSKPRVPLLGSVDSETHISTSNSEQNEDSLEEEPGPGAARQLGRLFAAALAAVTFRGRRSAAGARAATA